MKIDLHTHSVFSPDGGITQKEYEEIIAKKLLDVVAITDHNSISYAKKVNQKLGERIIVGEEIMSRDGEVIGLFLTEEISHNLSLQETISQIHMQGGLVYIPHPFETVRHGIKLNILEKNVEQIDIIETYNGRAMFRSISEKSKSFAKKYNMHQAASSDAHSLSGIGSTYTTIDSAIYTKTLLKQLKNAKFIYQMPPFLSFLSPKINKAKKYFNG